MFGDGQYRPQTADGQRLLAHELTHVVQPSKASGAPARADVGPSDNHLEAQAARAASAATRGRALDFNPTAVPVMVQRQARSGSGRRPRRAAPPPGAVLTAAELFAPGPTLSAVALRALMRAPLPSNLLVNGSPVPTSAARERRDSVDGDEHASRRTPRFNVDPSVEGPAPVRSVGIGFFIRDFEISRVRSGSLRLNFFTDPSAELRLSLPASEQAPGRIQYEARTAIALLQMQWGRDARQLTELMLGRIEASAQQVRDAPFQPRGELSVGVSGTYRPTPGIELRGEAGGSIRPGGESADTQAGVSASANLEIEAHRNLVLFGRVQGRMVFEADGVRLEAETPFTAGLRFRF